jgi:hypothetical protein
MKSPKHLCYPTLPRDALTGLDLGVEEELGVDASKKDKKKSFPTWRKSAKISESRLMSTKIIWLMVRCRSRILLRRILGKEESWEKKGNEGGLWCTTAWSNQKCGKGTLS